jgi:chloramphenicol 3-O-phosphotransferase
VTTQIIFLNGGSSSGKSGISRCLHLEVDTTHTEALPCARQIATHVR